MESTHKPIFCKSKTCNLFEFHRDTYILLFYIQPEETKRLGKNDSHRVQLPSSSKSAALLYTYLLHDKEQRSALHMSKSDVTEIW